MSSTISAFTPFYVQYPAAVGGSASASSGSAAPASDVVDIRTRTAGTLTAVAGDNFALSDLFSSAARSGGSVAGYQVALRGGGSLELDGKDVTGTVSFTADQWSRLHFVAGPDGSSQNLLVVAQSGTALANGAIGNETDSQPVQLTANVTGARSLNGLAALRTQPAGADAAFVAVAQEASIFTGYGAARPSLTSVGNLTAAGGDAFSVNDLVTATAPAGGSVVGYRVAVRNDGTSPGGQLLLDGQDVTGRQSFSAIEYGRLQFVAGPSGTSQDLVVVAQSGTLSRNGTISNETDSPAVQITASSTGTRSINAAAALRTQPTGDDAAFVGVAQRTGIFNGFGAARPGLTGVGDLTAAAGDVLSVNDLFSASAPAGGSVAGYQVAVRGGGSLQLDGVDVSGKTQFTADQWTRLQYIAGPGGSSGDLLVVAQSGKPLADGALANEVDSPPVQITAAVTGTRSINAAGALRTQPAGDDAAFVTAAQRSGIFSGYGAARPSVATVGDFTATAGDSYSVSDLFTGTPASGAAIAGYQVALRNGGTLQLDGNDVSSRASFTAAEFGRLHFVAGAAGGSQDLLVAAQGGALAKDGTVLNEVDSPAVQITAFATGTRSINAASALLTQSAGADAAFVGAAQRSSIFSGFGAARPGLSTLGNFTAAAGDALSVSDLFSATAPAGGSVAGYQVAVRGGGSLQLDGKDVTGTTAFTVTQWSRLQYIAGSAGSSGDLLVVAQRGTLGANGTVSNEVDSPAVQITASVTGVRSLNAAGALRTPVTGDDAAFIATAQRASIFTGFGAARPGLTAVGDLSRQDSEAATLQSLIESYHTTAQAVAATDLLPGFVDTNAATETAAPSTSVLQAQSALSWALSATTLGGYQSAGSTAARQRVAVTV